MAKAYWVACYHSISNPEALAEYAKLAAPAIAAGGGRFLARGTAAKASPGAGPLATPSEKKSAALSGNFGACQRAGSVASSRQPGSAISTGARLQARSTPSVNVSGPSR